MVATKTRTIVKSGAAKNGKRWCNRNILTIMRVGKNLLRAW